jgi:hypothetical protein
MNMKALNILLLVIVVLGFSGVASAATQKVLVQEAYDEQVLVSEAYDEQVLVTPAWNETVFNHWLVNGEYTVHHEAVYKTVHHEAVYKTVHHEAVTHEEQKLVTAAYDEQVLVTAAYDEQVEANHDGYQLYGNGEYMKKTVTKYYAKYYQGQTMHGYKSVPIGNSDPCQSKDWKWIPVFNTVHHDAVYKTVHHEAVYETIVVEDVAAYDEEVLIAEAYDEQVLVSAAFDEQVPYVNNGPYFGGYPDLDWNDVMAWSNWIYSNGPNVTGGWGSWTPYFTVVFHEAVFETVHHEAVYETVHHEAIYKDVEVPEPVVPTVATEPVKEGVPMENTGAAGTAAAIVAILVLAGLVLVIRRK